MGSIGGASIAGTNTLSTLKESISQNYRRVSVDVRDKWGDVIDTHTGYVNSEGRLYNVKPMGKNSAGEQIYNVQMGNTSQGFTSSNSGLSEQEAWQRMERYLRGERR